MVAYSFNFVIINYRLIDNSFYNCPNTNFCLSINMMILMIENKRKIIEKLKKVNEAFKNIFNFIILLPVYYIGVGLTFLIWKIFSRKEDKNKKTYWLTSEKLKEEYEDYLKQF